MIHDIKNHAVWMVRGNSKGFKNCLFVFYLTDKYISTASFEITTIDRYDNFQSDLTIVHEAIVLVAS